MNSLADALARRLEADPANWLVRSQLAELYEQSGQVPFAVQTILEAPTLPSEPAHLALGARLLAGTRPDLALQYMQALTQPAAAAAPASLFGLQLGVAVPALQSMAPPGSAALPAGVPLPPVAPPSYSAGYPLPSASIPPAAVEPYSGEDYAATSAEGHHPRKRFGGGILAASIVLHAVFLIIAGLWVLYTFFPGGKSDKLEFTSEKPSVTANHRAAQHDVKMARRKNMGASPNARRISTTAASNIAIPDIPVTAINDFTPGMMGGGMGTGLGGWGSGSGGGGMGTGAGGGRIKFFGFEGAANSVILAIDTSGSMSQSCGGPPGIAKLREEIDRTINSLSPASLFNIICFGQQADACFQLNVRATAENKKRAIQFMAGYYGAGDFGRTRTEKLIADNLPTDVPEAEINGIRFTPLTAEKVKGLEDTTGSSRMDLAVVAAMERRAETIFLLSDGKPGTARGGVKLEENDLIKLLHENFQRIYGIKPLTIHTIYTNTDKAEEDFMRKVSKRFNGKHKDVKLG